MKIALITGAARGIGLGIAEELAETGCGIVIDDIYPANQVEKTLDSIRARGVKALYVQADISRTEDRHELVDRIKSSFGRLDILVNNAGVAPKERLDILQASEESFDRVLGINLKGPYFLTQLAANWMLEQKKAHPDRDLFIINIASLSSYASSPSRGEYCVSKAGISMMTKLFAHRLAEYGISVNEIRPGIIATDMTAVVKEKYDNLIAEGLLPQPRWGVPRDIAKAVAAIVQGYFPYSTGQVFNVDGGFHLERL
jgi:NAD(P)-dependent dehydrogenase (short-subunit alcohol dehydrogenase family)